MSTYVVANVSACKASNDINISNKCYLDRLFKKWLAFNGELTAC